MVWSRLIRLPRDLSDKRVIAGGTAVKFAAIATLSLSIAALSGCSNKGGIQSSAGPEMLAPEKALIFPPPGGPEIIAVVNRSYSNAVEQQVILRSNARTPGQNFMKVSLFGPQTTENTGRDSLPFTGFRSSAIAREIRSEFPGVGLSISAEYLQNSYGAFSYAAGPGRGDDTCLYGWQDIRSPERMRQAANNLGRIKVRVRVCQSGTTVQQLLTLMYNYTITGGYGTDSWNPYGTPLPPPDGIGRTGSPIYPVSATEFPAQPGMQVPFMEPARPVQRVVRPATPAPIRPLPASVQSPAIPSPSGMTTTPVGQRSNAGSTPRVVIPSPACLSQSGGGQGCS